jgi:hypothetical protein
MVYVSAKCFNFHQKILTKHKTAQKRQTDGQPGALQYTPTFFQAYENNKKLIIFIFFIIENVTFGKK